MQPTVGEQTTVRAPEASRSSALPPDEYTMLPGSAPQTSPTAIDQLALAQAAAAAAAMHEVPSILRTDGTPMPPFRMPDGVLGDELASVVGGHTFTSHGAVAVENRSSRWTIAVLAAAAMI